MLQARRAVLVVPRQAKELLVAPVDRLSPSASFRAVEEVGGSAVAESADGQQEKNLEPAKQHPAEHSEEATERQARPEKTTEASQLEPLKQLLHG